MVRAVLGKSCSTCTYEGLVIVLEQPVLSVTVSVIVLKPIAAYVWLGAEAADVPASPKSQRYVSGPLPAVVAKKLTFADGMNASSGVAVKSVRGSLTVTWVVPGDEVPHPKLLNTVTPNVPAAVTSIEGEVEPLLHR